MENIEQIVRIIRDSHLPLPNFTYLLDEVDVSVKEYHERYMQKEADERILLAIGKGSSFWEMMKFQFFEGNYPDYKLCITDKNLYVDENSYNNYLRVPLADIRTIALGQEKWKGSRHGPQYNGTQVIVNGKVEGRVSEIIYMPIVSENMIQVTMRKHEDPITSRFYKYLFAAMSNRYTLDELREKLSEWKNAPKKQIIPLIKFNVYWKYVVFSLGLGHLFTMYKVQKAITRITAPKDEENKVNFWSSDIINFLKTLLLCIITLGFYWPNCRKQLVKRINYELVRRKLETEEPEYSVWSMKQILNNMDRLIDHYNHNG